MSRSKWKGYYITNRILQKKLKKKIEIWERHSTIPYYLVDKHVFIHNGKNLIKTFISREKVGYKFGEFVETRKSNVKSTKKKTKKI